MPSGTASSVVARSDTRLSQPTKPRPSTAWQTLGEAAAWRKKRPARTPARAARLSAWGTRARPADATGCPHRAASATESAAVRDARDAAGDMGAAAWSLPARSSAGDAFITATATRDGSLHGGTSFGRGVDKTAAAALAGAATSRGTADALARTASRRGELRGHHRGVFRGDAHVGTGGGGIRPGGAGRHAAREVVESLEVALQAVARQHLETKFIRVDAERCPWLCEQLGITVLPSLVLVQQGKVVRVLHGLDTLCSASQQRSRGIAPAALERVLRNAGMAWEAAAADE
eukprot:ctg_1007.g415